MSLKYYINGTELTDIASVRIKGPHGGLTTAADGSYATSTVTVIDRQGSLSYINLQVFAIEESTATPTRVFTGRIFNLKITRGPGLTGAARQYEFEVDDLNNLLHLEPLQGANCKRDRESGTARIAWLLSKTTGLSGKVWDNGLVAANPAMFDEADYTDRYPDEVLIDTMVNPSSGGGIFFVYWDASAASGEEPSLFYDVAEAAVHTSTLKLSNRPAACGDIDDPATTIYPVHFDPELNGGGDEIYCGVVVHFNGGRVYRHNATTHTAFFGSQTIHRVAVIETSRIGRLATAITHGDLFLATHFGQMDTITCTVKLPAAKVNLIDGGHRLPVEFEHFPNFDDPGFTYTRVSRRTLLPFEDRTNEYYDLLLELSTKGIRAGASGDPGVFPLPPCVSTEHWWAETFAIGPGAPGAATDGASSSVRTLLSSTTYNYSVSVTEAQDGVNNPGGFQAVYVQIAPGDPGYPDTQLHLDVFANTPQTGSFTTTSLDETDIYHVVGVSLTPPGGVVLTGSVTFWIDPVGWVPVECPPPSPGQWVGINPPEYVIMTGANGTSAFPFANGSLRVFYDNIDQTAAILLYDGGAGTFVMASGPLPGWQVRVEYQGI